MNIPSILASTRGRVAAIVGALALSAAAFAAVYSVRPAWLAMRGAPPAAATIWTCPMHPEVREDAPGKCPKCGMDLVPEHPAGHQPAPSTGAASPAPAGVAPTGGPPARVDLTLDTRRQQLIGVRTARVARAALERTVRTIGLVRYDETRITDVNLKIDGWIRELYVDYTGQLVRKGQPLFTIYSPDVLAAQSEYLLALKTRDQLATSAIADARDYAQRIVEAARERLLLWDLSPAELAAVETSRQPSATVTFTSPASGHVIEKQALTGMRVAAGQTLYRVADLSVVWVEADVHEAEMAFARVGTPARVSLDAYPTEQFPGRVVYIYPFVEERTRTMKLRFELPNRGSRLKPGMFANVELGLAMGKSLVVPADAVLDSGAHQVVFVVQGDGYFEPRPVTLGQRIDGQVQILAGLKEGEEVASAAAFFLDSESQLRAAVQNYQPAAARTAAAASTAVQVVLTSQPDPPRSGENVFEVAVADAGGRPITDAQVSVLFYMAPMPSMNMPAMRSEVRPGHIENGIYRGPGTILMAGRWDVIITVTRGAERIATKQLSITAR